MNLAHLIDGHPRDRVALVRADDGRRVTYGELGELVDAARAGFARLGVGAGGRVALGDRQRDRVRRRLPRRARPRRRRRADRAVGSRPRRWRARSPGSVRPWSCSVRSPARRSPRSTGRRCRRRPRRVDAAPRRGTEDRDRSWSALMAVPPGAAIPPVVDVADDALAALVFTSGTAGAPKAAMLSHANLLANLHQSQSGPDPLVAGDVVYGVLPLEHVYGLNVVLGLTLMVGCTLVLEPVPRTLPPVHRAGDDRPPRRDRRAGCPADVVGVRRARRRGPRRARRWRPVRLGAHRPVGRGEDAGGGDPPICATGSVCSSPRATGSPRHRRSSPARPASRSRSARSARCSTASTCDSSTTTVTTCSTATPARSGCTDPTCSRATSTTRRRRPSAHRRRLAAHRRHRGHRRRRLPLPRRPRQGPHHRQRLQRLPGRGRGRARQHPAVAEVASSACPTRTPARR